MKFEVEKASRSKGFEDLGLKTMAFTYDDKIIDFYDENEEHDENDVYFFFSDVEINSIDELIKFKKRAKHDILIEKVEKYERIAELYEYRIKIYDYWIE